MPAYCKSCGYDLQGLPTQGVCPDCGRYFNRIGRENVTEAPPDDDLAPLPRLWRAFRRLLGQADR
ncbi:MAG: hypothetical protein WD009_02105 [Phycisphaeraceae bacterium]